MGLDQWIFIKNKDKTMNDTQVVYWRKCNQIHGWFDRLFDGVENCKGYPVTHKELGELKEVCQKVLDNRKLAEELLPVMHGSFFGSYEYDDMYFIDLKITVQNLNDLLIHSKGDEEYYYQAWW